MVTNAVAPSMTDMEMKQKRKMMKKVRKLGLGLREDPVEPWDDQSSPTSSRVRQSNDALHAEGRRPKPKLSELIPLSLQRSQSRRSSLIAKPLSSPLTPTTPTQASKVPQNDSMEKFIRGFGEYVPAEAAYLNEDLKRTPSKSASVGKENRFKKMTRRSTSLFTLRPPQDDEGYSSPTTAEPSKGEHIAPRAVDLKRSHSLWENSSAKATSHANDSVEAFQRRYDDSFGPSRAMSDKERMRAIKKARKITQLFGHEPPMELIVQRELDERQLRRRDSISTTFSQGSMNLLSSFPAPPKAPTEADKIVTSPTPPPFSDVLPYSEDRDNQDGFNPPSPTDRAAFSERRRRAAKLSRFFGVGFHDITAPLVESQKAGLMTVDVKFDDGRRFWSNGQRDVDVVEVIDRLRDLRAA